MDWVKDIPYDPYLLGAVQMFHFRRFCKQFGLCYIVLGTALVVSTAMITTLAI
jgi:hypothetical protein